MPARAAVGADRKSRARQHAMPSLMNSDAPAAMIVHDTNLSRDARSRRQHRGDALGRVRGNEPAIWRALRPPLGRIPYCASPETIGHHRLGPSVALTADRTLFQDLNAKGGTREVHD